MSSTPIALFWFRRDLRLNDNVGLSQALACGMPVLPIFIFDPNILNRLEDKNDRRVQFIHSTLIQQRTELQKNGGSLHVEHAEPLAAWKNLLKLHSVARVYFNRDYEPYALERDREVSEFLCARGVEVIDCKDQVIFECDEVQKGMGGPYTVFTPYSRKWKEMLTDAHLKTHPMRWALLHHAPKVPPLPSLAQLGFRSSADDFPPARVSSGLVESYAMTRNTPSIRGTSRLGLHLRFGTVSIRDLVKKARLATDDTWLKELIWREFFMQILWNFPHVVGAPFRPEYAGIKFRNDPNEFQLWCEGKTGYPIVDAGMRELNATGFMHNRVRMIAASFLVKHLLIDWRWGEAYFARRLLDFELASNNGNWQWVAGTGCDAAPYFRVFNPELQAKKFDPDDLYVRQWVPEIGSVDYPEPMISHVEARLRALRAYAHALGRTAPQPTRAHKS